MKKYTFTKGSWEKDFMYVYGPQAGIYGKKFRQEENFVINTESEDSKKDEYVSIVTKERYGIGTKISTVCDFDSYGAPLIVFSDDIEEKNNTLFYNLHFEVVAWENGCNVWHILPYWERKEKPFINTKIASVPFKIEDRSKINLSVTLLEGKIECEVNGKKFTVENPDIPKICHVGITACEGVNRFYELTIE
ncbi:MAG: hypothetical protein E7564_10265 [Ruminococcaceae bacterium]|nr:hypothetical protein [Oscillospiraceae bacterium]